MQVHQCREIVGGRFIFPHKDWHGISEGVKDLIRKMLVTDPAVRLTSEGVLSHPYINMPPEHTLLPTNIFGSFRYVAAAVR